MFNSINSCTLTTNFNSINTLTRIFNSLNTLKVCPIAYKNKCEVFSTLLQYRFYIHSKICIDERMSLK